MYIYRGVVATFKPCFCTLTTTLAPCTDKAGGCSDAEAEKVDAVLLARKSWVFVARL